MKILSQMMLRVILSVLWLIPLPALSVELPDDYAHKILKLEDLSKKFDEDKPFHMSHKYNEQNVRDDFIDVLFEVLGWDVTNKNQVLLYAQDSVLEARMKIIATTKYVDYAFRVDGRNIFFVEAKAASKDIDDPDFIFQAKRYAWSSGNGSIVILTDYETFRVYDASIKPDYYNPSNGELKEFRLSYNDYAKKFKSLWFAFSKAAVEDGSLKKLRSDPHNNKGKIPMEMDFINDFNKLRLVLATDIWKNNPDLSEKELNEATQDILNKILFARVLEDRDITPTKRLAFAVINFYQDTSILLGDKGHYLTKEKFKPAQPTLFMELQKEFEDLAARYNGAIFGKKEFYSLKISDETLKQVIEALYYPSSPYDFSVMPNDVIGKAHETYLGKKITIRDGKTVIADRPEVKSAGGVFYTPKEMAEFMVNHTLGEELKNQDISILKKIKILDPACGSGVFPAATAQKLFDFAEDYYNRHPEAIGGTAEFPDAIKYSDGKYYLSAKKRAEIVEDAIYCIDIDEQAVDNTKIWLYMSILEKANSTIVQKERQYKMPYKALSAPKKAEAFDLPNLNNNIIVGNALVSKDLGSPEENKEAKAFDWNSGKIGDILKNGGFDVIIGNPPYIASQRMASVLGKQYLYIKSKYKSMIGQSDIYFAFYERMLPFLKPSGVLAFLTSNKFLANIDAKVFRNYLFKSGAVQEIIDFNNKMVFPGVGVQVALMVLQPQPELPVRYTRVLSPDIELSAMSVSSQGVYKKNLSPLDLQRSLWVFSVKDDNPMLEHLRKMSAKFGSVATVFSGTSTGQDKVLMVEATSTDEKRLLSLKMKKNIALRKSSCVRWLRERMFKGSRLYKQIQ